ncbi:Crp/Fnr family transcriptional regulator [Lentzea sp. NPDC006480]|uniref:Crp/Fnr family transcriptional regulator n=1 Tax=Lentzea sp. NPDC006480 TaxID=3157176 RepID=UPI0033A0417B
MPAIPHLAAVTTGHRVGSFWRRLDDTERTALVSVSALRRFDTGATLIRAGEQENWVAILHRGRVRTVAADGRTPIAVRFAGDIVGEQAVLDHETRPATVRAETPVQALIVEGAAFNRYLSQRTRVLRVLCAVVSERLRESDRTIASRNDSFTKVAGMLLRHVDEFEWTNGGRIRFDIRSQAALGESLGLSRESVVRALKLLRKDGVIATHRGVITVNDVAELRARARR